MTHWPQKVQAVLPMGRPKAGVITVWNPRFSAVRIEVVWIFLHTLTQRRQRMHLLGSRVMDSLTSMGFRSRSPS